MQRRIGVVVFTLALTLVLGLGVILPTAGASAHDEQGTPLLGNLGDFHREITTGSEEAQAYFDQGLVLAYGFNHELAIQSFQEAIQHDPACAMCYWGIAWALGPNINLPMDPALNGDAWAALQKAQTLAADASSVEQAFINALAARYSEEAPENRAELDLAFAEAMGTVAEQYPDDADALAIYAEALMDLMPWNFWTAAGKPTEYTESILATLEAALALDPNHPAANHYYIHATEASQDPGRALESAQRLETLVPGAGHLVHMPAHTYWRVGRYADAVRINEHAAHSDETAAAGMPDPGMYNFYSVAYYPHNIHFLSVAAQMMGDSATAIDAARRLVDAIPEQAYLDLPFFEDFRPMPYHALVRFGRWQEMVDEPAPGEELPFATALWHYARGMALADLGRLDEAKEELAAVEAAKSNKAFEGLVMASFASAGQNLDMAGGILSAAIASAEGDHAEAIAQLEAAVAIQDSLPYIEPPAWYFPIRHLLGAELLADGQAEEAEAVYRRDLEQYPANGWSLFGLAQALEAQDKRDEALTVRGEFEEAWAGSDIVLGASACPCESMATAASAVGHQHGDDAGHVTEGMHAATNEALASQAVVEEYFDKVLSKGDAAAAAAILAPDFQRMDRSQSGATLGLPGILFLANNQHGAFSDLRYSIDAMIIAGDQVAVRWTATGTQDGAYGIAAATGKRRTWTGMSFFQLQDGKIVGEVSNFEDLSQVLNVEGLRISPSYVR